MHTVFFTGLSRADEAEIVRLFDQARGRLPQKWMQAPESEARVLVIDMDSIYGQMTLMKALDSDKVLVALTEGSRADTDYLLQRPVTVDKFAELLAQIAANGPAPVAKAAAAESAPAPSPAAPAHVTPVAPITPVAPLPAVEAAPVPAAPVPAPAPAPTQDATREPHLADFLHPGVLAGAVRLQLPGAPALVLDPASQSYFGGSALKPLQPYCTATFHDSDFLAISANELAALQAKPGNAQPFARLAWLCALVGGNGSLAPGYDLNGSYKLTKWPQTEREFPKHFRIATVMLKGPARLTEIAEQTGATLGEVIDFVNANLATGYATRG